MEKKVYFKNLNGLRFFAATAVIFHHIEQYKFLAGLPNVWGDTAIDALGQKAVSLFFVLSGFLITYLLLAEHTKTGDIRVKDFYVRRVLRIWPLYFFIVFLCLFIVPFVFDLGVLGVDIYEGNYLLKATLLLLVLPNIVRLFAPYVIGGNQLWSIGVEEQFYFVWPVLVRWFFTRLFVFLLGFIALKFLITLFLQGWVFLDNSHLSFTTLRFWLLLQIEQMAVGAIGAWILFYKKEKALSIIYHRIVWIGSLAAVVLLFFIPHFWMVSYLEAVIFVVLIMNLSTNPGIRFSMEHPIFTTLGNISYGIYMYHTLCITFCLFLLRSFAMNIGYPMFNVILYSMSVVLTVSVAFFSYEYFEKRFLLLKAKFTVVKSGADIKDDTKSREIKTIPTILAAKE